MIESLEELLSHVKTHIDLVYADKQWLTTRLEAKAEYHSARGEIDECARIRAELTRIYYELDLATAPMKQLWLKTAAEIDNWRQTG